MQGLVSGGTQDPRRCPRGVGGSPGEMVVEASRVSVMGKCPQSAVGAHETAQGPGKRGVWKGRCRCEGVCTQV